jgi:hypothetical protein
MAATLRFSAVPFVIALVCLPAMARDLPRGWRLPTEKELSAGDRNGSPSRYARAFADFNGDGVEDEALLLRSTTFNGEAVWVYLSNGATNGSWVKLYEEKWDFPSRDIDTFNGIDVVAPGIISYGGYCDTDSDGDGTRPKLRLRDPSIETFHFERSSAVYFWSRERKNFICVWTSD